MLKRYILVAGWLILVAPEFSFAGTLMAALAPDYYAQGLVCEAAGELSEAKVFYEKALLLDQGINVKEDILKRVQKINDALSVAITPTPIVEEKSNEERVSPRYLPERTYEPKEEPKKEAIASLIGEAGENWPSAEENNSARAPVEKAIPESRAKKPNREFLTYYKGTEPFLQNCNSPLCQKLIFNLFGISYAEDGVYPRARGMFGECLKIDPYFKPAIFNLSLLDELEKK